VAQGSNVEHTLDLRLPDGMAGVGDLRVQVTANASGAIYEHNATGTATSR
jgi:hypothetical protein